MSTSLPEGFVDELKARIRPSDVIGRKVKLKRQGKEWVGLSPFTSEKTPSFYVNDQKKIFKCFSSGLGGDVISFLQETERLSFMEAVERLAEEAGLALPTASPQDKRAHDRRTRLRAACEAAAAFFQHALNAPSGEAARRYLTERRGLGPQAWTRHRIGHAPDAWRSLRAHLMEAGFHDDDLIAAGLAKVGDKGGEPYDLFRNRIMFPIEDRAGHVIAFGGRALDPQAKAKYMNSPDTDLFHKGEVLYRYRAAREALGAGEAGGLIVCEGYMDVIALAEAGIGGAVAPLGTALTQAQLGLVWKAGPHPVLCFDGDAAGLRAAWKALDLALPHLAPGQSVTFALLPDRMDPDDLVRARGPEAMQAVLDSALPLVEMLWRRERDAERLDTPEAKAGLDARLMAAARTIQHPGVRSAYERDLRQRMNDHLWTLRRAARGTVGPGHGKAAHRRPDGPPPRLSGLGLLVRAILSPDLIDRHAEDLARADFPDRDVCALRDALLDAYASEGSVDLQRLLHQLQICGNARAAGLLRDYLATPDLDHDGTNARLWLIALERFGVREQVGEVEHGLPAGEDKLSSEVWKRVHRRVAERKALVARLNDAADETDES